MRPSLIVCGLGAASALLFASAAAAGRPAPQTLNPSPPPYYTCTALGHRTICVGNPPVDSYGPIDTADEGTPIVCGTGTTAFHVFDSATDVVSALRVYDEHGDLVRRVLADDYTFGEFSNPLTGAAVHYSQSDVRIDDLTVPGDLGSFTETTYWNVVVHAPTRGEPLLVNIGRTVTAPDGTVVSRSGRLDFFDIFLDGKTSLLEPLCAALGG